MLKRSLILMLFFYSCFSLKYAYLYKYAQFNGKLFKTNNNFFAKYFLLNVELYFIIIVFNNIGQ